VVQQTLESRGNLSETYLKAHTSQGRLATVRWRRGKDERGDYTDSEHRRVKEFRSPTPLYTNCLLYILIISRVLDSTVRCSPVLPGNSQNFGRPLRRQFLLDRVPTWGTCRPCRDLSFSLDLDLDLDLLFEIFKVKVKTLTSIFSRTVALTTIIFDHVVHLCIVYRLPKAPGRDPHSGGCRTPSSFRLRAHFSQNLITRFFLF
jgi:hypothetical protein